LTLTFVKDFRYDHRNGEFMHYKKLNNPQFLFMTLIAANLSLIAVTGCAKSSDSAAASEDTSSSGSVASAIGGANSGSTAGGTMSMNEKKQSYFDVDQFIASLNPIANAHASTACGTLTSTALTNCLGSHSASITYNDCSFGSSTATWNGSVNFACPNATSITREVTNGTTRSNSYGSVVTINTSNLAVYNSNTALTGGGTTIDTNAGTMTINGVQMIGVNSGKTIYNHVITSSALTRAVTGVGTVVNGTVTTYHNLARVTGTATVTNLTFVSGCCTPTSGTISTVFQTTNGYAALLSGFNGATETLTFTACGTATYTGPEGLSGTVALANCI
jgi:hypothetical protein